MSHCTSCGEPSDAANHERCEARRAYEPPRFCPQCGRRMIVQVTPMAWTATCSRHAAISSADDPGQG